MITVDDIGAYVADAFTMLKNIMASQSRLPEKSLRMNK